MIPSARHSYAQVFWTTRVRVSEPSGGCNGQRAMPAGALKLSARTHQGTDFVLEAGSGARARRSARLRVRIAARVIEIHDSELALRPFRSTQVAAAGTATLPTTPSPGQTSTTKTVSGHLHALPDGTQCVTLPGGERVWVFSR